MMSKPRSRIPRLVNPMAVSKALVLVGLLCAVPAWALQTVEIKPDGTATARISLKETSRIKVDGQPIVDLFGAVYSPDNVAGELMVAPDPASGEMYVMPSAMARQGKPINIFVKTERATYTLLLTPVDIPSETVILNDRLTKASSQAGPAPTGEAPDWLRQIKNMMLVLTGDAPPPGYVAVQVGKAVGLWQEARFLELRRVTHRRLTGSVFDLTNVSETPMVLDEREFFDAGVVATGIVKTRLAPNESTRVYVIRERRGE